MHKELFNAEYRKELGKIYLKYGQPIHSVGTARSYGGAQSGSPVTGINSFAPNSCHDTNALYLAREQFKQGIHLARGDAELRTLYASTLLQTGQPEEGVCQLETAVLLRPLQQDLYENLALGYVTAAQMWQRDVSSATSMGRGGTGTFPLPHHFPLVLHCFQSLPREARPVICGNGTFCLPREARPTTATGRIPSIKLATEPSPFLLNSPPRKRRIST